MSRHDARSSRKLVAFYTTDELIQSLGHGTRQSKITKTHTTIILDENITWLQVPMDYISRLDVIDWAQYIVKYYLNMIDVKGRWLYNVEYLFQIFVDPRDHEEQAW